MTALICDVLSLILLGVGALLSLSAAVGLVRFRDTVSRLHAVTKPQTLGLLLALSGACIRIIGVTHASPGRNSDLGFLVLIMLFSLLTAPVVGQRLGRIAREEKLYDHNALTRDDTTQK